MRVLVISDYRSYHTVRPEAHIFIGLAKKGVDVYVATYSDSKINEEFKEAGVHLIDFHPEKKFDKGEINKIRELIIENKIDILHLFNSKAIINGIKAAKGLDVKVVLYRGFSGNIHWYDPTAYFKFLNPRVDKIQCNSIGVKEIIDSNTLFGKSKTIAINKGHDLSWYADVKPHDIRAELGLSADAFVAVNVANNRKMKGIPYLLDAFRFIPEDANIHLVIAGRDMDTKENLEIIKRAKAENRVHLLGFRKDALSIVAGADIFILSSLFGESITKAVIESMSLGTPPIITDIPGNVELVEDGKNGLVVPSKNSEAIGRAVLSLNNDREKVVEMGRKSKERIAGPLNTKTTVEKVYKMYQDLLSN